ncbi:MAG: M1 family aminopeptidase, partial [Bacteroidia bacterium]|nr:M1 family aminopeptidase [Bacteroidia bacterium]
SIEFMEEHTMVPFPWESYAQVPVQDYIYGAMENTTATIFGDFFCVDKRDFLDRNYINVNVHELTHQWFGDLITGRCSKEIWLQESFATFYPKLFARKIWGEDRYQHIRRGEQNAALEAGKKDDIPIRSVKAGTARWYPKGSAVLDMLMYVYGEDEYRRVIRHYLNKHAYKNVATIDLEHAFEDTLGKTPEWFFDQWIYRGGEPHYHVSHQPVVKNGESFTEITVRQIHPRHELVGLFKMPIVFEVYYDGGGMQRVKQWVEKETEKILVPNPGGKKVEFVLFDPGSYILKKLTFPRTFEELRAQALKAPNMIDRYDALYAMREFPLETRRPTLLKAYEMEKFHYTKGEIVAQLIDDPAPESIELIQRALLDPDPEVRRAVISNTKDVRLILLPYYERLLADSSYNIVAEALEKLARQYPGNVKRYLALTQNDYGEGNRVKIKWLEVAYAFGSDKSAAKRLVEYASNSYEFRTRQNAMFALKRINYIDDKAAAHMVNALFSVNSRLSSVASEVLKHFYAQHEGRTVIERHIQTLNLSEDRKQTLKQVTG